MRLMPISLALLGFCLSPAAELATANNSPTGVVRFEVSETAGIRRRSDVVSGAFKLEPPPVAGTKFRVTESGKPIASQIRPRRNPSGAFEAVQIDFIANFEPLQTRRYRLEYGVNVDQLPEPETGFVLKDVGNSYRVLNRNLIEWTIHKNLEGLFLFRKNPDLDYVKPNSAGLVFRTGGGELQRLSAREPSEVLVTRAGPICCALEFQYADWPKGAHSKVTMEFVRTKSWVRTCWSLTGGKNVIGLGTELQLALTGREKLIDFGANDFVYTTVRGNETAVLDAGPVKPDGRKIPWMVLHGTRDRLQPQIVGLPGQPVSGVAGWVHVMDDSRCTALALGHFAQHTRDRMEVDGSGRFLTYRAFDDSAPPTDPKTFEFWVHFVGMPVHQGARTSPQAMRAPLVVVRK